jgi:signal peptide peptidase SppA
MISPEKVKLNASLLSDFVHKRPWAILPERLNILHDFCSTHSQDKFVTVADLKTADLVAQMGGEGNPLKEVTIQDGNAIIPVHGILSKRMSFLLWLFGGESTEIIQKKIEAALEDEGVKAIVLDFDSPGGMVDGIKELGDFIYESRGKKPIKSYISGMGMSAAYWIAAAADEVIAFDTAHVGSIGVWTAHYDISKLYEKEGVNKTYIYAGKYKVMGHEAAPLNKESKEYLQSFPDKFYSIFVSDVARYRGVSIEKVLKDMADGKQFVGDDALKAGLVDRIGSFKSVLGGDKTPVTEEKGGKQEANANLSMQAFTHNSTTAPSEPGWGSVDKTKLPRIAHARTGESKKKNTWGYPHHWVKGGKSLDENGVYKDGTLYLHKGGLNAAWAAAQGARSGKKASSEIISHLQSHRKALGLDKETKKSEEGKVMDRQEFIETHPELYTSIVEESRKGYVTSESVKAEKEALEAKNTDLEAKNTTLKAEVEDLGNKEKEAIKAISVLEEKGAQKLADGIVAGALADSDIPEKLHENVKKTMPDYHSCIKEDEKFEEGSEPAKAFKDKVEAQVKDWESKLPKGGGTGLRTGKDDEPDETAGDVEFAQDLVKDVTGGKLKSDAQPQH